MARKDVQITVGAKVDKAVASFERLQKKLYVNGKRIEGYGEAMGKVFDPAMKGVIALGGAVAGVSTAVGISSYKIAGDLEEAMAIVKQKTGEGSEALKGYEDIVRDLYRNNPVESYSQVALALAKVRTSTDATGERLKDLTQQFISLADVTGADLSNTIKQSSRLFGDWSVSTEKQSSTLDTLFVSAQKTGSSIESLAEKAVTYGTKFRQLGFSLEEALGLLGKWTKEGVSTEKALSGLGQAITHMTKEGVTDLSKGWKDLTSRIKEARTEGEAINMAVSYFGADAAPDMAAAIRENRFELGEMAEALKNTSGAIAKADEESETLTERLIQLRNTAKDKLLEPIGDELADYVAHVADLLDVLVDWADKNEVLKGSVDSFLEGLGLGVQTVEEFKKALNNVDIDSFKDSAREFGEMLGTIYEALEKIATAIPWETLLKHADTLTQIVVYGWAAGKVLAFAAAVQKVGAAFLSFKGLTYLSGKFNVFKSMMGHFYRVMSKAASAGKMLETAGSGGVAGISAIGSAGATAIAQMLLFPDALDKVNYSVEDMNMALAGSNEALLKLPPAVAQWLQESGQIKEVSENIRENSENLNSVGKEAESAKDKVRDLNSELEKPLPEKEIVIKEPMFSNSSDLLSAWYDDRPLRQITDTMTTLRGKLQEIKKEGAEAMETLGLSASEAENIMRTSAVKAAEQLRDALKKENPYLETAFVAALEKTGRQGGDALVSSVVQVMQEKMKLPLKELTDGQALRQALGQFQKNMAIAQRQAKEAMSEFGTPKSEALGTFKDQMIAEATDLSNQLKSKNPQLANAFIKALKDAGKKGGGKLLEEITSALKKAKGIGQSAFSEMAEPPDWTDGKKTLYEDGGFSVVEDEWQRIHALVSSGSRRLVSETENELVTSWTQGGKAITETFDKAFQTIRRNSVDLYPEKPDSPEEKKKQTVPGFPDVEKIGKIFDDLDLPVERLNSSGQKIVSSMEQTGGQMSGAFKTGLDQMVTDAKAQGQAIGNELYTGVMLGVNRSVLDGKKKLASIKAPKTNASGVNKTSDSSLARAITEQGSDL